ncbi:MAG TPA: hypothetical protein VIU93_14235 [Gallionellaceae bacterium]
MLNDPLISIEINDESEFALFELHGGILAPNSAALSEARVSDFLLGATRVKKQYETLVQMKDAGASSAWLLVSAYYCAFFACIEISKLFNRMSFGLDSDDIESLKSKASGSQYVSFFEKNHSNFVGFERAGKLVFRAIGSKPHVAAWDNGLYSLKQIFSSKGWPEVNQCIAILESADHSPSKIRNVWNYKRSDYYGASGEQLALEFKKLVGNLDGSGKWLARNVSQIGALDPCIIPALCEPLAAAVINASHRAGNLLKQAAV